MIRDKIYILSFFLRVPGDLSIPDVHWSGELIEARAWAKKRLAFLGAAERSADRLRPLVYEIRTDDLRPGERLTPEAAFMTYEMEPTSGEASSPV